MRIVVLDGFTIDQRELGWDELGRQGELTVHPRTAPSDLADRATGARVLLTNKVSLGREAIESLPDLAYVGVLATGTNVVDLDACRARRIAVTNVPGYCGPSVAQFAFAALLHLLEGVPAYVESVKANGWAAAPDYCYFLRPRVELAEKIIAVLGLGSIGGKVADIARAFGMRVLPTAVPGGTSQGRVPLESALAQADVVSLHCPLTDRTRRLVSREFLAAMKPGAVLVNTSRGGLVDEAALREALAQGKLGGAVLDVLAEEPPPRDHPLLDRSAPWASRVVVTPHVAWGTVEARRRLIHVAAANLAAFTRGERQNRVD